MKKEESAVLIVVGLVVAAVVHFLIDFGPQTAFLASNKLIFTVFGLGISLAGVLGLKTK